jgi:ATP-binding cassette subfamily B protein
VTVTTDEGSPGSLTSAPLSTPSWLWRSEALTGTSFPAMLRRLRALLGRAARLGRNCGCRTGSGGQWQRLAAARATFRDAPLLICDEPSAALHARAEHALFRQLRSRGEDRTTVLVSHRLANVRHVDRIYVLHEGRLVEQGSHDELMAAGGRYAELFTLQASGYQ